MLECLLPPPSLKYTTQTFDIFIIKEMKNCPSIASHQRMMRMCSVGLSLHETASGMVRRLDDLYILITQWVIQKEDLCVSCIAMLQKYDDLRKITTSISEEMKIIHHDSSKLQRGIMELNNIKATGELMLSEVNNCRDRRQQRRRSAQHRNSNQLARQHVQPQTSTKQAVTIDLTQQPINQAAQFRNAQQTLIPNQNLQQTVATQSQQTLIPNQSLQQTVATQSQTTTTKQTQIIDLEIPPGNP